MAFQLLLLLLLLVAVTTATTTTTLLELDAATADKVANLSRRLTPTALKTFYGKEHREWLQRMFEGSFRGYTDEEKAAAVDQLVDALVDEGVGQDSEKTRMAALRLCVVHKAYNLPDNFLQTLSPVMQKLYPEALRPEKVEDSDLAALGIFYERLHQRVTQCL